MKERFMIVWKRKIGSKIIFQLYDTQWEYRGTQRFIRKEFVL